MQLPPPVREFTVPLRRVMVVQSDLPYSEGVAAAEVLRELGWAQVWLTLWGCVRFFTGR